MGWSVVVRVILGALLLIGSVVNVPAGDAAELGQPGVAVILSGGSPVHISGDDRGDAVAVFPSPRVDSGVWLASVRVARHTFASPHPVPGLGSQNGGPVVAVSSLGDAVLAWAAPGRNGGELLKLSYRRRDGWFGVPATFDGLANDVTASIAFDRRGNCVVVYEQQRGPMAEIVRPRRGHFGRPISLPWTGIPEGLAFDSSGHSTLFFASRLPSGYGPAGLFEAVVRPQIGAKLSLAPRYELPGPVAVAPSGKLAGVYLTGATSSGPPFYGRHDARSGVATITGGVLGPIEPLPSPLAAPTGLVLAPDGLVLSPYLNVGDTGGGASSILGGDAALTALNQRFGGHSLGLATPTAPVSWTAGAGDGAGDLAVGYGDPRFSVRARLREKRGSFSPPISLAGPALGGAPGVVVANGIGTAVWLQHDGTENQIVARDFDARSALGEPRIIVRGPAYIPQSNPRKRCSPPSARTLAASRAVRVFSAAGDGAFACDLAVGRPRQLTLIDESHLVGDSRAIALGGHLVAYAISETLCGFCGGLDSIDVIDARTGDPANGYAPNPATVTFPYGTLRIRRLVLKSNTAIAYSIPGRGHGAVSSVIALDHGAATARTLASSRGVDPGSVELRGTDVTWREYGHVRSAPLH